MKIKRRNPGPVARPAGRGDLRGHAADDAAGRPARRRRRSSRRGSSRSGRAALAGALSIAVPAGHPRAAAQRRRLAAARHGRCWAMRVRLSAAPGAPRCAMVEASHASGDRRRCCRWRRRPCAALVLHQRARAGLLALRRRRAARWWSAFAVLRAGGTARLRLRMGRPAAAGRGAAPRRSATSTARRSRRRCGAEHVICWVCVHGAAGHAAAAPAGCGRRSRSPRRPGAASSTSACSRCGWASSPGTAAWPWAARCA